MPTYEVKSRTTGPTVVETVQAKTREEAIHKTLDKAADDEHVEVMQATELAPDVVAPTQTKK
jgi:hypothetical protein